MKSLKLMLACVGNANDPNTFGGLPYHLNEADQFSDLIKDGFNFSSNQPSIKIARYLWNLSQLIKTGKHGGFQYSELFLNKLWSTDPKSDQQAPVLNLFQLYPEREMARPYVKYFYLDQTLTEVFDYYGNGASMSKSWQESILARERAQYAEANKIIFRSHWAANKAKANYNLRQDKVSVVLPGANISQSALEVFDKTTPISKPLSQELKLIFVGKEWKRKGLDRLLRAMRLAKTQGVKISLSVLGVEPTMVLQELAQDLSIEWIGFFDKSRNPLKFIELLSKHDIGVLLSRSEAGGISLREFGRAGLPVIAPDTGGSPEFAMSEAAFLFAPNAPPSEISQTLIDLAANRPRLDALKRDAWARRREFDWSIAIEKLSCLL